MLDFRKSDLLDEAYLRYLNSIKYTMETIPNTGNEVYKFISNTYLKNLKSDIKILDKEVVQYRKFVKRERKHVVKLEKLAFEYIEDVSELSLIRKIIYFIKKWLHNRENKKFVKVVRKYRPYIPREWFGEDEDEEIEDVENSPENTVGTGEKSDKATEQVDDKNTFNTVLLPENETFSEEEKENEEPKRMTMLLEELFAGETEEE